MLEKDYLCDFNPKTKVSILLADFHICLLSFRSFLWVFFAALLGAPVEGKNRYAMRTCVYCDIDVKGQDKVTHTTVA